jgi:hypothetical protein
LVGRPGIWAIAVSILLISIFPVWTAGIRWSIVGGYDARLLIAGFEVSSTADESPALIVEEPERRLPYGLTEYLFPGDLPSDIVGVQPTELNALDWTLPLRLGGLMQLSQKN